MTQLLSPRAPQEAGTPRSADSTSTWPPAEGATCECNLGPLCRHHRVKQTHGWRLTQPEPGIYTRTTPSGWQYTTGAENYAA
jgi:hypothetical protein